MINHEEDTVRYLFPYTANRNNNGMQDFERVFEDFFATTPTEGQMAFGFKPNVDIKESEDFFLISADLPGLKEDEIKIEVKDKILTISGERNYEKSDEKLHRFERQYGKFERSFQMPNGVDLEKVQANYENGALEVLVPREEVTKPKAIKIQSNKGGLISNLLNKSSEKKEAH